LEWLDWPRSIAGLGAPYALAAAGGLHFAPAADQGALNPGCMPLFVALIAAIVLGERFSSARKLGALADSGGRSHHRRRSRLERSLEHSRALGDALFLVAAFLSACFHRGECCRRNSIHFNCGSPRLHRISGESICPLPRLFRNPPCRQLPLADIAVQALFQGVVVTIVFASSVWPCGVILGASGGFGLWRSGAGAIALFAIPLLGEWPNETIGLADLSARSDGA